MSDLIELCVEIIVGMVAIGIGVCGIGLIVFLFLKYVLFPLAGMSG